MSEIFKIEHGIKIYDQQPSGTRLAKIYDFSNNGVRNLGMKFYVKNISGGYEEYTLKNTSDSNEIKRFIEMGLVYVYV